MGVRFPLGTSVFAVMIDQNHCCIFSFWNDFGWQLDTQFIENRKSATQNRKSAPRYVFEITTQSVQGDSGHAQADMVTEFYGHIIDEDRRKNAELMEWIQSY